MSLKNNIKQRTGFALSGKTTLLLVFLVMLSPAFSQSSYVAKYKPLADSLSEAYGIPASVMLGIAILESGSGTSRNSRLLNNHFGIVGRNNLLKTKGIKTRYKQYPDVASSYIAFCKLQAGRKYYSRLKGTMDYAPWIDAISRTGYSEVPETWKKRVISVIKKHKLDATE